MTPFQCGCSLLPRGYCNLCKGNVINMHFFSVIRQKVSAVVNTPFTLYLSDTSRLFIISVFWDGCFFPSWFLGTCIIQLSVLSSWMLMQIWPHVPFSHIILALLGCFWPVHPFGCFDAAFFNGISQLHGDLCQGWFSIVIWRMFLISCHLCVEFVILQESGCSCSCMLKKWETYTCRRRGWWTVQILRHLGCLA